MPALETIDIPLGFEAPAFTLKNVVTGSSQSLEELKGKKATVMMFICNHCPYVKHIMKGLVDLANDYTDKGISFIGICSNDGEKYPADAPDKMAEVAAQYKFPFPYLHDATQEVAIAYKAACTPDFSIFDQDNKCVYRGQLDNARPGKDTVVDGADIRAALDKILSGEMVNEKQIPSIGCSIKWKNGDPYHS